MTPPNLLGSDTISQPWMLSTVCTCILVHKRHDLINCMPSDFKFGQFHGNRRDIWTQNHKQNVSVKVQFWEDLNW